MTDINDLVLIYVENQPLSFARVEAIEPDMKPGWYQVTFLLLQLPLAVATWILRDAYINGDEFTMGGKYMRLEKVVAPIIPDLRSSDETTDREKKSGKKEETSEKQKVISLSDFKKK